jgi:transposase-like protein
MASKGQKFRKYDSELKKKVVNEYLTNHTDLLELAYTYKIASQESILQWVKNYNLYGEAAFDDKRGTATSESAPLKGRPRKNFDSEEEKSEYTALVKERKKEKAKEKRRLEKARKIRENRKALEIKQAAEFRSKQGN